MGKIKRPPGLKTITTDDLLPGDILLYNGKGTASAWIRCFDESYVNHSGICIGKDEKYPIIEACKEGVIKNTFEKSFKDSRYIIVKRLRECAGDMGPVLDVAKMYNKKGNRYEFEGLIFLAIISLVGKIHRNRLAAWIVTRTLKQYFSRCLKNHDKQPMICSELVYRCYNEAAGPDGLNYSFLVDPIPMIRSVLTAGSESSMTDQRNLVSMALRAGGEEGLETAEEMSSWKSAKVMEDMYRFTCENIIKQNKISAAEKTTDPLVGFYKTVAHFVTPRDIFKSKSLTNVGIIELQEDKKKPD